MITGSKEWHEARRRGIGGSDAPAVAGLSSWKTPLEIYLDKIGESVNEESPDMRRGTLLEPAVRQMYCDATGLEVIQPNEFIRNPDYPFAFVNLDGIAGNNRLLECKTSRNRAGWGEPGSDEIPIAYMAQVQHGLAVARLDVADVAVLFGDFDFAIFTIEPDREFQELLFECEARFWERVIKRIPPDPASANDIKLRWPTAMLDSREASEESIVVASCLNAVKRQIKLLEGIQVRAETYLKAQIEDSEGLSLKGDVIATWKNAKGATRFDAKRFQAEQPAFYKQYLNESPSSRRFLLKGGAKCLMEMSMTMDLAAVPPLLLQAEEEAAAD